MLVFCGCDTPLPLDIRFFIHYCFSVENNCSTSILSKALHPIAASFTDRVDSGSLSRYKLVCQRSGWYQSSSLFCFPQHESSSHLGHDFFQRPDPLPPGTLWQRMSTQGRHESIPNRGGEGGRPRVGSNLTYQNVPPGRLICCFYQNEPNSIKICQHQVRINNWRIFSMGVSHPTLS